MCVFKIQVQILTISEWTTQNGIVSETRGLKRIKLDYKDFKVGTLLNMLVIHPSMSKHTRKPVSAQLHKPNLPRTCSIGSGSHHCETLLEHL